MTEILVQLQKNIFAITFASAVFLGFSLAYLFSVGLQYFFNSSTVTVAAPENRRVAPSTPFRGLADFEPIVTGNLIRDSGLTTPGPAEEAGQGEITVTGILAGAPSFARAAIQIAGQEATNEYRVNETVAGFKIIAIRSYSILVERGGNQFRIGIGEKSGEAISNQQQPAAAANADTTKVTLSRDRINALLANPQAMYDNKFAPITRDGRILGFKLMYVPTNNFLYEIGARSGDIIRRFNDQPLDNQDKMIQMYQSIRTANRIKVDIERGGKIVTFELIIQ